MMTISMSTEEDQSHVTEKILDLTLEILYLLIGEEQNVIKKTFIKRLPLRGLHRTSPTTEVPPNRLTPEINSAKKILEVTKRMIELLTGEVPIRCQDVTVYFSMEEWEYLEGHKDLYKDVMMEDQPPLTSPDGSRKRNSPETCPRPLDSWDSTREDQEIPQHDQCEEQMHVKVKIKEEEMCATDYKQSMEEIGIMANIKQEEPLNIIMDGRCVRKKNTSRGEFIPDYTEDNQSARYPPTTNSLSHNLQHTHYRLGRSMATPSHGEGSDHLHHMNSDTSLQPHNVERSSDPSNPTEYSLRHDAPTEEGALSSLECRKLYTKTKASHANQKTQKALKSERPYVCSECGKSFTEKRRLLRHGQIHTGERPFSCLECGKHFMQKANLLRHHKSHTGERPYSCLECGKCFILKSHFVDHIRIHTGERPYDCSVCGKCFTQSAQLIRHQRIHTGERPYSCSECGKGFTQKGQLVRHQINHTGERPFSCLECGKRFVQSRDLNRHQKVHKKNFMNL